MIANLEKCSIGIWENGSNACHVDVEIDFSQIPICSPINISMSLIIPGAIYPMPIYNSVKYLRRRVLKKNGRLLAVNYFCLTLCHICLAGFWIHQFWGFSIKLIIFSTSSDFTAFPAIWTEVCIWCHHKS